MTPRSRHLAFAVLLASTALSAACAAGLQVHSYTETGSDMRRYRTYSFGPADRAATGDPRLDDNPFFNNRVQLDVERQLASRGYEKANAAGADIVVHYHATVSQQMELNDRPRPECLNPGANGTPQTPPSDCRPYVYDAGTLLIDLVDRRTNKVVWRGWAEGSIDGVLDNQDWMEKRIDDTVTRIMEQLPRRS